MMVNKSETSDLKYDTAKRRKSGNGKVLCHQINQQKIKICFCCDIFGSFSRKFSGLISRGRMKHPDVSSTTAVNIIKSDNFQE